MMKKVTKAVIPAAGLGTRVLPATKAMPKGMLPIVDKPAIQYLVEEAVRSGITDILIIVALITKIIGCGLAAKICRFNWGDSLKIGVGMMTRGEVALIVAQKGLDVGVVDSVYFTAVILLIVVSSVATPLVLKALFTKMPPQKHPSQVNG